MSPGHRSGRLASTILTALGLAAFWGVLDWLSFWGPERLPDGCGTAQLSAGPGLQYRVCCWLAGSHDLGLPGR